MTFTGSPPESGFAACFVGAVAEPRIRLPKLRLGPGPALPEQQTRNRNRARARTEALDPLLVRDVASGDPCYPWPGDALASLRPGDVREGVRRGYRADGELCEFEVGPDGKVNLTQTGTFERDEAIAVMRRAGHMSRDDTDLEAAMDRAARRRL